MFELILWHTIRKHVAKVGNITILGSTVKQCTRVVHNSYIQNLTFKSIGSIN